MLHSLADARGRVCQPPRPPWRARPAPRRPPPRPARGRSARKDQVAHVAATVEVEQVARPRRAPYGRQRVLADAARHPGARPCRRGPGRPGPCAVDQDAAVAGGSAPARPAGARRGRRPAAGAVVEVLEGQPARAGRCGRRRPGCPRPRRPGLGRRCRPGARGRALGARRRPSGPPGSPATARCRSPREQHAWPGSSVSSGWSVAAVTGLAESSATTLLQRAPVSWRNVEPWVWPWSETNAIS